MMAKALYDVPVLRDRGCMPGDAPCPGSCLYLYESVDGGLCCCGCPLHQEGDNARLYSYVEILVHLERHEAAGHHFPKRIVDSMRDCARLGYVFGSEAQWTDFVE